MAPATRTVVELHALGDRPPGGTTAKAALGIQLSVNRGTPRQVTASVCYLIADRLTRAVTVDGSLDDWPLQPASRAGAFRLVGRRGATDGFAVRQTLATAQCDGQNLYLAIRCDEPTPRALVARSDNTVRYEQLMPVGEDLVEVLLDPGQSAQTAAQLFHLLIKSNGVVIAERGINTRPPLGHWSPWPAGVQAAVRRGQGDWTAEIAIPLSAFGPAGRSPLWGLNVTRFATTGSEASSWSGARRYFYDPRGLGTMFCPALAPATR